MEDKEAQSKATQEVTEGSQEETPEAGVESSEEAEALENEAMIRAREEADLYKDRWLRLAAEFENYKKRTAREFDAMVQSAGEEIIRDLLPILDGVNRALAHQEDGQAESGSFQEGMKMIMEQLPRLLENRNLKAIETVGKPFDPNVHEALMQMPSETYEAGMVASEVEKGYSLGNKVLRPAKVVVSLGKPEDNDSGDGD